MLLALFWGLYSAAPARAEGPYIFWVTGLDNNLIQRSNLDGTDVITLSISPGPDNPRDLAVDNANGKLYWTDSTGIHQANLDGSSPFTLPAIGGDDIALDASQVYWSDGDTIKKADLEGSNVITILQSTDSISSPAGLAVDSGNNKIYWTDNDRLEVRRANLDGSDVKVISDSLAFPEAIAVSGSYIYWADSGAGAIYRAGLDGSNPAPLVSGIFPYGLSLDPTNNKIYWSERFKNKIRQANLNDGSGVTDVVSPTTNNPRRMALYLPSLPPTLLTQIAKIVADDRAANDLFGYSVSLAGDTLAVGAYGKDNYKGAVYLFGRNQGGPNKWGQVEKVTASDSAEKDNFGYSVSLAGDTLAVGAGSKDNFKGAVYLFGRNQGGTNKWGQVEKVTASDGVKNDSFGVSVSLAGDTLAVGAGSKDNFKGAVYLFGRNQGGANNWGQVNKVTASDGAEDDNFGVSVSLAGDTLVVGAAYGDDDAGSNSGAAYLFGRNQGGADNWGQVNKVTASDSAIFDFFGKSVSLAGDTLAVGAYGNDNYKGAAYLFAAPTAIMGVDPTATAAQPLYSPDNVLTITIPAGVLPVTATNLLYNPVVNPTVKGGTPVLGFSLQLIDENNQLIENVTFNPPLTITITYQQSQVPAGIKEENFIVQFTSTGGSDWEIIPKDDIIKHDTAKNTITFYLRHLTTFALSGPMEVYLPLILK